MTDTNQTEAAVTGKIIPNQEALKAEGVTMADLVVTYNHLTGKAIKKFESIATGMRRVEMCMLAAKDNDAHTGVPKGTEGQVKGADEIEQKAEDKGVEQPAKPDADVTIDDDGKPSFALGTMAAQLQQQADAKPPITPRERKTPATPTTPKAPAITHVVPTFTGKGKGQPGSQRTAVLNKIELIRRSELRAASIEELDKHFDGSVRGYIQKLIILEKARVATPEEIADAGKLPPAPEPTPEPTPAPTASPAPAPSPAPSPAPEAAADASGTTGETPAA